MTDIWDEIMDVEWSAYLLERLYWHAHAAGSTWKKDNPATISIPVSKKNAETIYCLCRGIRAVPPPGVTKKMMKVIKAARMEAHRFLYEEANDPNTSIDRKIQLVKLTSKHI